MKKRNKTEGTDIRALPTKEQIAFVLKHFGISKKDIQDGRNGKTNFWFCLKGFYREDGELLTLNGNIFLNPKKDNLLSFLGYLNKKTSDGSFERVRTLSEEEFQIILNSLTELKDLNSNIIEFNY